MTMDGLMRNDIDLEDGGAGGSVQGEGGGRLGVGDCGRKEGYQRLCALIALVICFYDDDRTRVESSVVIEPDRRVRFVD